MSCNIIQLSSTRWDALGLLRKARKAGRISQINFSCGSRLDLHCSLDRRETLSSPEPTPCPPVGPTRVQEPAFKSVVLLEEARPCFTTKKEKKKKKINVQDNWTNLKQANRISDFTTGSWKEGID